MRMAKLNHTFGEISKQQFSDAVSEFIDKASSFNSISCIDQGIKTLSIMYVSLDDSIQKESLSLFKQAVAFQIDFERSHGEEHKYNIDSVDIRSDLSIESALSHEMIN